MGVAQHELANTAESASEFEQIFDALVDGLIITERASGRVLLTNPAAGQLLGYGPRELVGRALSSLIHPDSRQQFNEQFRSLKAGGKVDVWTRHVSGSGDVSYSRWRAGAFQFRGQPCLLWTIRDVSERTQAEQTLRQRLRSRNREQSVLLDISHTLASSLEFPPGLVLDQFREVVPFIVGAFFGLEGDDLVAQAVRGKEITDEAPTFRIKPGGPETLQKLFNARKAIRLGDLWGDDPQAILLRPLLTDDMLKLLDGMHSWMWVPLVGSAGILGGLGVAHSKRNFFTPHHADLAQSVASQVVVLMLNAELHKKGQSAAAAQERQRLAQSLHDAVNQSLFSAGLIAEVLPRVWDHDQELARQSLEDLRRLLRGAAAEMRALLAELRPSTLTEAELGSLLRLLSDAFTGRTSVPVALTVQGEGTLPAEVQLAVYRICQEALNNVARHAEPKQVRIALVHLPQGFTLSIRDDGRGFDPAAVPSGHYGLGMMRERAEAVCIQLLIRSAPGEGTELTMSWTVAPPREDQ